MRSRSWARYACQHAAGGARLADTTTITSTTTRRAAAAWPHGLGLTGSHHHLSHSNRAPWQAAPHAARLWPGLMSVPRSPGRCCLSDARELTPVLLLQQWQLPQQHSIMTDTHRDTHSELLCMLCCCPSTRHKEMPTTSARVLGVCNDHEGRATTQKPKCVPPHHSMARRHNHQPAT